MSWYAFASSWSRRSSLFPWSGFYTQSFRDVSCCFSNYFSFPFFFSMSWLTLRNEMESLWWGPGRFFFEIRSPCLFVCVFNLFVGCGAEVSLLHAAFTDRRNNFRALLSKDGEKKKKRMTETAGGGGEKGSNKDASEWERNAYSI